jgi:hypothetical protein
MMRSESTSALGQPSDTKPTRGAAFRARDLRAGLGEDLAVDFDIGALVAAARVGSNG